MLFLVVFVNFSFFRYAHDTSSAQCSELSEFGSKDHTEDQRRGHGQPLLEREVRVILKRIKIDKDWNNSLGLSGLNSASGSRSSSPSLASNDLILESTHCPLHCPASAKTKGLLRFININRGNCESI
jgi:hypothetical protein